VDVVHRFEAESTITDVEPVETLSIIWAVGGALRRVNGGLGIGRLDAALIGDRRARCLESPDRWPEDLLNG
jgi:hypothetical protein